MKQLCFLLCLVIYSSCTGPLSDSPLVEGRHISTDHGLVVSAHRESSRAGIEILKKGGNAVDAAVATEFALAVCYPEAGNIGGGGFMLIRIGGSPVEVIDYREKAPLRAGRDMFLDKAGNVIEGASTESHLASGVPGTVEGMVTAHSKYGKLPFADVIAPAIVLAENGYPLSEAQANSFNSFRDQFLARNSEATAFVKDSPWRAGDIFIQKELAETLKKIRDFGRDGFYEGTTAEMLTAEMERGGGLITSEDLSQYRAVIRSPLQAEYRGHRIYTASPPSGGGLTLLQLLGIVESYSLGSMGFHSAASMHLITEASRRAYADRAHYLGDPDFINVPVTGLLSKNYLAGRMGSFDPGRASLSSEISSGDASFPESEETTHYSVVDAEGNAVSATTTLNGTFGSGIVVAGAGFLLNNQMDDFSVKPGFPNMYGLVGGEANSIAPGKRMLSSMTPVIIEKDGSLMMVAGSPGGSTIPTSVFQVVTNVIDFGMTIGQAVDTGRFHHQWLPDWINIEKNCVDSVTADRLKAMGHTFNERSAIGRVNAILVTTDGKRRAGADKRGENAACGY
ncbi:MAG: gamma-glutamyltransferase [Bacteroidales bacterium]|jgi:gamma-glutamyltranspeptidase/glutathione hydrolase|nr:gamma-glutamyltransferase [Bacteroidales bacterium]MCU0409208.1 gamma-glutamyltransferase [Bacteroidales bacterium]